MISRDTTSATSSRASADGRSRYGSPDGKSRAGRAHVRANRSALRDSKLDQTTLAISGLYGSGSSESADLTRYLANRCRELLGTAGSTMYRETWKERATPSGLSYWEHTASALRTSGNGSGGWLTPMAYDAGKARPERRRPHGISCLMDQVPAGWATPRVTTNSGHGSPERATDGKARLEDQVHGWRTPLTNDAKKGAEAISEIDRGSLTGQALTSSPAPTEKRGQLNPAFVRWLMGFPEGWERYAVSATPLSQP